MENSAMNIPLLLEPEQLQALIGQPSLLIIDICNPTRYQEGHIEGAIHISPAETQLGTPPAPGKIPTEASLDQLFKKIGLTEDKHVVVYDDEGGGWAGRFIWLLDSIGHVKYSYLNGGYLAWEDEKRPLTTEVPPATPSTYNTRINHNHTASIDEVLARLDDPETAIWDARSPQEFSGEKVLAAKKGHIPGAANFEWTQAMDPKRALRVKDQHLLLDTLAALGLTTDKKVITHCQTHHRSGFTYLVAKILGFKEIKAYDGSWSEWGNHPETPVES
ncbi:rhodanese-like domain-containing protein [Alkalimarinus sediminis]|uniref:Rhodanese-like domain-containing protein n=1 Tax=Alkalimarinus sediminis TaxID=1632866 RepID=A0A9E8KIN4_9ALTE|nr:rhodanese-like domain-containing protein [Alkalimarinus sediminis]UZW74106.1 rhodanese-like domain-containing protein [Alkalimarinus sediminis]